MSQQQQQSSVSQASPTARLPRTKALVLWETSFSERRALGACVMRAIRQMDDYVFNGFTFSISETPEAICVRAVGGGGSEIARESVSKVGRDAGDAAPISADVHFASRLVMSKCRAKEGWR